VGSSTATAGSVGSIVDLPPHSATLGLRFYTGLMFPVTYHNRAFYAEHGSWDRTLPSGYAVGTAAIVGRNGEDEAAIADSTTGPYQTEEFFSGFRFNPPVECVGNADCPGNSSCQTRAPASSVQKTYCGGKGRPADVAVLADGSLLVTDEMNSLVYRISYRGPALAPAPPPSDLDVAPAAGVASTVVLTLLASWGCLACMYGTKVVCKRRAKDQPSLGASEPMLIGGSGRVNDE
jgi:hypothetical protein